MREGMGKYRGKRVDNGGWVYGWLESENYINTKFVDNVFGQMYSNYKVDPDTVGQFTGYVLFCEDLYFGDLVSNNWVKDATHGKEVIREVVLHQGVIAMKIVRGNSRLIDLAPVYEYGQLNFKIVGNIHDNPELLKA